jgi:ABC-type glycerol-3-phosphate transport system substrate-binding protein
VPPDVAGVWDAQLAQFADLNALEPLDDLAAQHGINAETYKPVYWETCRYKGRLFALPSTPSAIALHYNKLIFWRNADKLRAAGLDPTRAPRTIDELDRYAKTLDVFDPRAPDRIVTAGYMPNQSWYTNVTSYWFGTSVFNEQAQQFEFTNPANVRAFTWFQSYFRRMGAQACDDFKSGIGDLFNSSQNPFLSEKLAMQQQGPWMANYIYNLQPEWSERLVPKVLEPLLPRDIRTFNYAWGVAPFPTDVPGLTDVSFCGLDILVIPKGAKHPKEAMEFMAYISRQDVAEKINSLHCKNSPLRKVSDDFLRLHMNPYIDVFERLARSPNAHGPVKVPIHAELADEITVLTDRIALLRGTPEQLLAETQQRMAQKWDEYRERQRAAEAAAAARGETLPTSGAHAQASVATPAGGAAR